MKQRILGALRRHAELAARDISVDVRTDGSVRIVGKVDNRDEREAVEQAVWSAPGVTMVEDALQIA
jgi:osmotically-inducible protein OsmY